MTEWLNVIGTVATVGAVITAIGAAVASAPAVMVGAAVFAVIGAAAKFNARKEEK